MIIIIDEASAKLASFYYHDEIFKLQWKRADDMSSASDELHDEFQEKLYDEQQYELQKKYKKNCLKSCKKNCMVHYREHCWMSCRRNCQMSSIIICVCMK